jgi:putative SOS response-associated peptidase YedK
MCGRYRRITSEEELARLYHIPIPSQTDLPISYNIAPSQKVLTIRFNPETQARAGADAGFLTPVGFVVRGDSCAAICWVVLLALPDRVIYAARQER